MPLERHQRAHRHVHRPQLCGIPEIRQIDDEAGGDYIGADLALGHRFAQYRREKRDRDH